MDTLKALKLRRSIREYSDKPLPKEAIERIIDAARFAPTARNVQPWEFVVITDRGLLGKLGSIADNGRFIAKSRCCIAVFCSDTKYYLEDGCAATVNILNAAASLGIGSCWVAGDKKPYCEEISRLLGATASFKLISLVSLGYPVSAKSFFIAEKRNCKEITHWEKF